MDFPKTGMLMKITYAAAIDAYAHMMMMRARNAQVIIMFLSRTLFGFSQSFAIILTTGIRA